jgi:hypothetical protein
MRMRVNGSYWPSPRERVVEMAFSNGFVPMWCLSGSDVSDHNGYGFPQRTCLEDCCFGVRWNPVAPGLRRLRKSWCIPGMFCIGNSLKCITIKVSDGSS